MATVPLTSPYSLKAATLAIGADDYTAAVSGVTFTPSTSTASWRGIGGNTVSDVDTAVWACQIDHAQDLSPAGLTRYLLEHAGETVAVVFTPKSAGPAIEATITLTPAAIGGSASSAGIATATATCPVTGAPEFDDA